MDLDAVAKFLSTVGFPIAVSVYLLIRLDHTLRSLTAELTRVRIALVRGFPRAAQEDDAAC